MATITGGCLCGKIRYRADAEPRFVSLSKANGCAPATGRRSKG